jgi:hypothetical protein
MFVQVQANNFFSQIRYLIFTSFIGKFSLVLLSLVFKNKFSLSCSTFISSIPNYTLIHLISSCNISFFSLFIPLEAKRLRSIVPMKYALRASVYTSRSIIECAQFIWPPCVLICCFPVPYAHLDFTCLALHLSFTLTCII